MKNIYLYQSESIKSNYAKVKLYGLESRSLENNKYSLNKASVTFPSNFTELNSNPRISLSLSYIPLQKSANFTQNLVIVSIFDLETTNQLQIRSEGFISIEIPFNLKDFETQSFNCLFFNYSSEKWSDQGCFISNFTPDSIICKCNHLSSFTAGFFQLSSENNLDLI